MLFFGWTWGVLFHRRAVRLDFLQVSTWCRHVSTWLSRSLFETFHKGSNRKSCDDQLRGKELKRSIFWGFFGSFLECWHLQSLVKPPPLLPIQKLFCPCSPCISGLRGGWLAGIWALKVIIFGFSVWCSFSFSMGF